MKISPLLNYKVIEFDHGIVIVATGNSLMQRNEAVNLIESSMEVCCEYLARYTQERGRGKSIRDSHRIVAAGMKILAKGHLDQPGEG
jgi:hypothetical protein